MKGETKRFIILAILFSILTITFSLLYYFKVITHLGLMLAVTYTSYFVGIALLYNGAYARKQNKRGASKLNVLFGFLFVCLSIGLLIYGLVIGEIILF